MWWRNWKPLIAATVTVPLVAEINVRHFELFLFDVFPNVHLRPVRERKHAHVFAGIHAGVVKIPNFRPLIFRVPLAERIAETEKSFFRAGFFLVAPRAADGAVELKFL